MQGNMNVESILLMKTTCVFICFKICRYKWLTWPNIGSYDQKYSTLIKCNSAGSIGTNLSNGNLLKMALTNVTKTLTARRK